jgi:iron complex transport system substrate-binding protein
MIRKAGAVSLAFALMAQGVLADPSRVLVIGGTAAEIVAALGQSGRLVARDATTTFPPELMALPDVGYMRALSPEGVLSTAPDLILAEAGAGPVEAVEVIKASGIPYVTVSENFGPDAVAEKIKVVGAALGQSDAAATLAAKVETGLAEARAKAAEVPAKKRVLFVLTLQGGRVTVGGDDTAAEAIIELAGGVNAAEGVSGYKTMTDEAILAAAPDVILMMERAGAMAAKPEDLTVNPALAATPAGQAGTIVQMDGLKLLGFGPRTPEAAQDLRRALYGA